MIWANSNSQTILSITYLNNPFWCLLIFSVKWLKLEKALVQMWHSKGLTPSSFLLCLVNSSDQATFKPQCGKVFLLPIKIIANVKYKKVNNFVLKLMILRKCLLHTHFFFSCISMLGKAFNIGRIALYLFDWIVLPVLSKMESWPCFYSYPLSIYH